MTISKPSLKHKSFVLISKRSLSILPILLLLGLDASAAIDVDAGAKAATEPVIKLINDYYPAGIFIAGAFGAFLQPQGDLKERMVCFGKGALVGGLVVAAVKAGLGI